MSDEKKPTCFVVMPIADMEGYESAHFGRVYEYLIKPAVMNAGFVPFRADDTTKSDYIVVGIIQKIIDCDMVLCDISGRNPNVMYELGIRHAFNLPVTLIKDRKTDKIFDIQGLRYAEYDSSLRVDSVSKETLKITEAILETSKMDKNGVNSIVRLAGIQAAQKPDEKDISPETQYVLGAIESLNRRISSLSAQSEKTVGYLKFTGDQVEFHDGIAGGINEPIYDSKGEEVGILKRIIPEENRIILMTKQGKLKSFNAFSEETKQLCTLPF